MYLRWKQRRAARGKLVLTAVLVRSERRNGKPRQKIVAYLGTVDNCLKKRVLRRHRFWERVDRRLDELTLDPALRQNVEAGILAVVSRPSPDEVQAAEREYAEVLGRFVVPTIVPRVDNRGHYGDSTETVCVPPKYIG
jgi:hypothetical protein